MSHWWRQEGHLAQTAPMHQSYLSRHLPAIEKGSKQRYIWTFFLHETVTHGETNFTMQVQISQIKTSAYLLTLLTSTLGYCGGQ